MTNHLEDYLQEGANWVEGWLDPYSARFIADFVSAQGAAGIGGGFGEIGVHHGRLFIVLCLGAGPGVPSFAIDVFDDQHLNTDGSGHGDRARFEANLRRWSPGHGPVGILQRSSLDVTPEEVRAAAGGPCRFVSIDGGHTAECTLSDLRLAEAVLHERGVALLDDVFREDWPDVPTGLAQYCLDVGTALRPFIITPNKVFLARPERHVELLAPMLAGRHAASLVKHSRMYGGDVAVFRASAEAEAPTWIELDAMMGRLWKHRGAALRHAVSRSPLGPLAIRLRAAVARGRPGVAS